MIRNLNKLINIILTVSLIIAIFNLTMFLKYSEKLNQYFPDNICVSCTNNSKDDKALTIGELKSALKDARDYSRSKYEKDFISTLHNKFDELSKIHPEGDQLVIDYNNRAGNSTASIYIEFKYISCETYELPLFTHDKENIINQKKITKINVIINWVIIVVVYLILIIRIVIYFVYQKKVSSVLLSN